MLKMRFQRILDRFLFDRLEYNEEYNNVFFRFDFFHILETVVDVFERFDQDLNNANTNTYHIVSYRITSTR